MGLVAVSLATTVDGTVIGERSTIECVEYLFKVAQYSVWFVRGGKYCVEISCWVDQSHVTAMVNSVVHRSFFMVLNSSYRSQRFGHKPELICSTGDSYKVLMEVGDIVLEVSRRVTLGIDCDHVDVELVSVRCIEVFGHLAQHSQCRWTYIRTMRKSKEDQAPAISQVVLGEGFLIVVDKRKLGNWAVVAAKNSRNFQTAREVDGLFGKHKVRGGKAHRDAKNPDDSNDDLLCLHMSDRTLFACKDCAAVGDFRDREIIRWFVFCDTATEVNGVLPFGAPF